MKFIQDKAKLKKDIIIRSIKMLDIGLITVVYFTLGYTLSWSINKIYTEFNPNENPNKLLIFLEVCAQIFIIGVLVYILRNLIMLIPFPLDGIYGYKHARVRELSSGGIALTFGVFFAQDNIQYKLKYILN